MLNLKEIIEMVDKSSLPIKFYLTPEIKKELVDLGYFVQIVNGRINIVRKKRQNE